VLIAPLANFIAPARPEKNKRSGPFSALQPARGQARLPSLKIAQELMAKAKAQGWGNYDAEVIDAFPREDAAAYP